MPFEESYYREELTICASSASFWRGKNRIWPVSWLKRKAIRMWNV
jgi:hypothetical protein